MTEPAVAPRGSDGPIRVSICMATYKGREFVAEQVASILDQLGADDELVIVDDASPDDTVAVLQTLTDPRIRLFPRDHNLGYVKTFQEALGRARGEFRLLSDQDDVWTPDHVTLMVAALAEVDVVATNLGTLGGADAIRGPYGQADWRLAASDSNRRYRNIIGIWAGNRPYYGCAMGLRADALARGALPIPNYMRESHDLWFALYGNIFGSIRHLEQRTVLRRFHATNQTPNRPRGVRQVIASRLRLLVCTATLVGRRARAGRRQR